MADAGQTPKNDGRHRRGSGSIADGFRKLAIATVVFGVAYVLFFSFCWIGD